jgi:glycerol uptake facilitator protein
MPPRPLTACCLAEAIGTFLLVFFGCGAVHCAVLAGDLVGLWQVGVVWGIAIMLAIYVVGAISGAHINPAITVGLAVWKLFPWLRVGPYIAAQFAGAVLASLALFTLYEPFLLAKELQKGVVRGQPGSELTAMCYAEYFPNPATLAAAEGAYSAEQHAAWNERVSEPVACLAELLGTSILALVVMAVTEQGNQLSPKRFAPVFIGLTVAALICFIAPLTQACFNPARDFGPRVFAYFAGWGSIAIPGSPHTGFLTVYIISPLAGGILGVGLHRRVLRPALPLSGTRSSA